MSVDFASLLTEVADERVEAAKAKAVAQTRGRTGHAEPILAAFAPDGQPVVDVAALSVEAVNQALAAKHAEGGMGEFKPTTSANLRQTLNDTAKRRNYWVVARPGDTEDEVLLIKFQRAEGGLVEPAKRGRKPKAESNGEVNGDESATPKRGRAQAAEE